MMTISDILCAAYKIEQQGKTPTIALIKNKLKGVSLPLLIQGLQEFKNMSASDKKKLCTTNKAEELTVPNGAIDMPEDLIETVNYLKRALAKQQIINQQLLGRINEIDIKLSSLQEKHR